MTQKSMFCDDDDDEGDDGDGMHDKRMNIFVELFTGTTIILAVKRFDLVETVKAYIEDMEGVPVALQRLFYGNNELEDDLTLDDYKLHETSVLTCAYFI